MVHGVPGSVPQTAKREQFARLIAQGTSSAEACRIVGVNPGTVSREMRRNRDPSSGASTGRSPRSGWRWHAGLVRAGVSYCTIRCCASSSGDG